MASLAYEHDVEPLLLAKLALERGADLGAQLLRVVGGVVGEEELGQRAVDAERALEGEAEEGEGGDGEHR